MVWWLKWSLWIVCITLTIFPIWYGFFNRWWTTRAGISILLLSSVAATAWDLTLVFNFIWPTVSIETAFWIQMIVHVLTIGAGLFLLYALWYNRSHGQMVTVRDEKEQQDDQRRRRT